MERGTNQKLKILYLMKILLEKTDENHSITMPEILSELEFYDIPAERKSIYNDIETLRTYGLDIVGEKEGKVFSYRIVDREFELAELKLLVDSVQAAKFITAKKSQQLIKKIEKLASKYEAAQLQRQVYTTQRVKTDNESIFYNVDKIHAAIASNTQIEFHYFTWTVSKKQVLRRNGEKYKMSPWALSWDDENYYLVAYDNDEKLIKHFRVDKMLHIELLPEKREGAKEFKSFDLGAYARKTFDMFSGEEEMVKLLCTNDKAGIMIDRFGKDVPIVKVDDDHFYATVKVAASRHFFAWVMSLGEGVQIVGPERVVNSVREQINRLAEIYN